MTRQAPRESITIFFPAYNDAGSIESLVETALAVLPTLADEYEVLVINDGSTDSTAAIIDKLATRHPAVKTIHHERNTGYGGALRSGFRHASKDLVFYTDGDGQYDVRELAKLHWTMTPAVDVVNGYKISRSDTATRRLIGWCYKCTARFLFRLPIRDVDCDFRLLRRKVVENIELSSTSGAICVELVRKLHTAGCVFADVPVHHYPRAHGRSQFFTVRRVARTALDFCRLWFRLVLLHAHEGSRKASAEHSGPFSAKATSDRNR
jgi:glycosyltransferase involved in cell wall biosynthesis